MSKDIGPWDDYEMVKPVGIVRKGQAPTTQEEEEKKEEEPLEQPSQPIQEAEEQKNVE